ncbi:MAG: hypothetical protein ACE5H8_15345 [Alphaproteobacteria bacterium]
MFRNPRTLARGAIAALALAAGSAFAAEPTVIVLTQIPCQFVESENGIDRGFKTTKKADCEAINARTGAERLAEARVLELKPGPYIFRVTNKNVPYELGFWLREHDYDWRNPIHKLTKISVSGGGLKTGMTKDYEVELEPGEYLYSCPLNTTPDYRLVVKAVE